MKRTVNKPNGEYKVSAVSLMVELSYHDAEGRVTARRPWPNDPEGRPVQLLVYEAEFFPGLLEFLRSKGLKG